MRTIIRDQEHLENVIREEIRAHGIYVDLNHLDVSAVTDMGYLFYGKKFQGNISQWDVSNVTKMNAMFWNCPFSGDLSQWNVGNVEEMHDMFLNSGFDGHIANWNVSRVRRMDNMFRGSAFQGDISTWSPASGYSAKNAFSEWNHSMLGLMGVLEGVLSCPAKFLGRLVLRNCESCPKGSAWGWRGPLSIFGSNSIRSSKGAS